MQDKIVVGYDGSQESVTAVRWAALEGRRRSLSVEVVHVWGFGGREGGGAGTSWLGKQVVAEAQQVAEDGAQVARESAPGVQVDAVLEHGSPAAALVRLASDGRLVVLGRHGVGQFGGAMVGSVTSGVLHHAISPVVVVPQDIDLDDSGPVLVGFDGSPGAFQALDAAVEEARVRRVPLSVIVAWTAPADQATLPMRSLRVHPVPLSQAVSTETAAIADRARSWLHCHPEVSSEVVVAEGRAKEQLVRRSRSASLTVVGTRGRGGFVSLVLGSVSRAVVHRAHSPVLVTRDPRAVHQATLTDTMAAAETP